MLETYRSIRRRDLRVCDRCDKLGFCTRCMALALHEDGDLRGPSSWACHFAETMQRAADSGG